MQINRCKLFSPYVISRHHKKNHFAFCERCSQLCFFGSRILFFRECTGSCRWLLCVFFVCLIGPIHLKLIAMVHVPVQVWLGPTDSHWNQKMEEPAWILYIYDIYIYICKYWNIYYSICIYFMIIYIYIMCVKVSWAVLSFSGCFLDDLFTVVSICTPRMAYFLKSENMFSIFRFVQAVCQLHS